MIYQYLQLIQDIYLPASFCFEVGYFTIVCGIYRRGGHVRGYCFHVPGHQMSLNLHNSRRIVLRLSGVNEQNLMTQCRSTLHDYCPCIITLIQVRNFNLNAGLIRLKFCIILQEPSYKEAHALWHTVFLYLRSSLLPDTRDNRELNDFNLNTARVNPII